MLSQVSRSLVASGLSGKPSALAILAKHFVGFGRGLPDLAAATKVWRDFAETPEAVYRDGYAHIAAGIGQTR